MIDDTTSTEPTFRGELVVGLLAPVGTRLDALGKRVADKLGAFGFGTTSLKLSNLLRGFPQWNDFDGSGEGERIAHLQSVANQVRSANQDGAMLARVAIDAIRRDRELLTGDPAEPADGHAWIISQLKHPAEVELLRRVYGPAFLLIAGHATRQSRINELAKTIAISRDEPSSVDLYAGEASNLIQSDDQSPSDFGQNVQDSFPLADVFVDMNPANGEYAIDRFLELEFGHPFHSPKPSEVAMYQASAVALRSSDFNRQVGAAIVQLDHDAARNETDVEVLAVGMNEVPKGGGGFYWGHESPDCRDQRQGDERASQIKVGILAEMISRLNEDGWLGDKSGNRKASEVARDILPVLKGTQFMGIGEFSRPVHAEVAAIIDAARRGVRIDGSALYVTTFPCHNCAKHIIAAGITQVIYLEPYPKSRARSLYEEEIVLDSDIPQEKASKIVFHVYSGIAPRKYRTLFSMSERGGRKGIELRKWEAGSAILRPIHVPPFQYASYFLAETAELPKLHVSGFSL